MIEALIVCAIVGMVLILAGRSLYLTLSGRSDGCGCGKKACSESDICHDYKRK